MLQLELTLTISVSFPTTPEVSVVAFTSLPLTLIEFFTFPTQFIFIHVIFATRVVATFVFTSLQAIFNIPHHLLDPYPALLTIGPSSASPTTI